MKSLRHRLAQLNAKMPWIKVVVTAILLALVVLVLYVIFHEPPVPDYNDPRQVVIVNDATRDFAGDGWDLFGWSTFVTALFSLLLAFITWTAQKDTEKHTRKAPISAQLNSLRDLARHFYRNLVCTTACIVRFNHKNNKDNGGNRVCYPSESNLRKMHALPDDVVMDIDTDDCDYSSLHELKLLLRNYNVEVDVASMHLSRKNITNDSLEQDIDNLIFKPLFLVKRALSVEKGLTKPEKDMPYFIFRSMCDMVIEHFTKLMEKQNFVLLANNRANILASECIAQLLSKDSEGKVISISEDIDVKGGLARSFNNLVDGLKSDETNGLVTIEEKTETGKKIYITLKRDAFLAYLKSYISTVKLANNSKKANDLCEFIDKITATDNRTKIIEEYIPNQEEQNHFDYKGLNDYFAYLASAEWDYFTLLNYMLAVDVVIETDRIGMINY